MTFNCIAQILAERCVRVVHEYNVARCVRVQNRLICTSTACMSLVVYKYQVASSARVGRCVPVYLVRYQVVFSYDVIPVDFPTIHKCAPHVNGR